MVVDRKFTVISGGGGRDGLLPANRERGDHIVTGGGSNSVTIDDSLFAGNFTLTTGAERMR